VRWLRSTFPFASGQPGDPPMLNAQVVEVPGEIGPELGAVVGSDPLDGHGEALA